MPEQNRRARRRTEIRRAAGSPASRRTGGANVQVPAASVLDTHARTTYDAAQSGVPLRQAAWAGLLAVAG
ncbi:hypothetical protein [Actinophytocola sp.]|uniref:hypothetical protein n=1 Tax=Actinophytocola sp. TaxID=1872138 RepID=UPI003899E4AC